MPLHAKHSYKQKKYYYIILLNNDCLHLFQSLYMHIKSSQQN